MREATVFTAVFVLLGLAARVVRWRADVPLWGDEAAVALNLLDHGYRALAEPIGLGQIAPLGFLWIERTLLLWLGPSEASLRLLPLIAGISSLLCFAWLCRLVASKLGVDGGRLHTHATALLPLAVFAVSYYPIRYSGELKPYGLDILVACLLQGLAAKWLLSSGSRTSGTIWAMAGVALAAPWFSYPSGFVGAGIAIALLPAVFRTRSRPVLAAYLAFALAFALSFAISYGFVGRIQTLAFDGSGAWLARYWWYAFPPLTPFAFVKWVVLAHTGQLFAYPNGSQNGGSTVTFLLFVVGSVAIARSRTAEDASRTGADHGARHALLGVLLLPFALGLLAACARLYPYGGSIRIGLFLAPAICLVSGIGAAAALGAVPPRRRRLGARAFLGLLFLFGAATILRDVLLVHGPRDAITQGRRVAKTIAAEAKSSCLVSLNTPFDLVHAAGPKGPPLCFYWHLRLASGSRWSGNRPLACSGDGAVRVVLFSDHGQPAADPRFRAWERASPQLRLAGSRQECASPDCLEVAHVRDYVP